MSVIYDTLYTSPHHNTIQFLYKYATIIPGILRKHCRRQIMKTAYILRSACSAIMCVYFFAFMTSSAIAAEQSIVPQTAFFAGARRGMELG